MIGRLYLGLFYGMGTRGRSDTHEPVKAFHFMLNPKPRGAHQSEHFSTVLNTSRADAALYQLKIDRNAESPEPRPATSNQDHLADSKRGNGRSCVYCPKELRRAYLRKYLRLHGRAFKFLRLYAREILPKLRAGSEKSCHVKASSTKYLSREHPCISALRGLESAVQEITNSLLLFSVVVVVDVKKITQTGIMDSEDL